jgi:hypothetical protein
MLRPATNSTFHHVRSFVSSTVTPPPLSISTISFKTASLPHLHRTSIFPSHRRDVTNPESQRPPTVIPTSDGVVFYFFARMAPETLYLTPRPSQLPPPAPTQPTIALVHALPSSLATLLVHSLHPSVIPSDFPPAYVLTEEPSPRRTLVSSPPLYVLYVLLLCHIV